MLSHAKIGVSICASIELVVTGTLSFLLQDTRYMLSSSELSLGSGAQASPLRASFIQGPLPQKPSASREDSRALKTGKDFREITE